MNSKQASQLVQLAVANFPHTTKVDMTNTARLWQKAFDDIEYQIAEKALLKVLYKTKFFPTLHDIRYEINEITKSADDHDALESWNMVIEAVKKYGYMQEQAALASLPPDVANLARQFGWTEICCSTNLETLRAQWRMAWNQRSGDKKQNDILPKDLQKDMSVPIIETNALERQKLEKKPERTYEQTKSGKSALQHIKNGIMKRRA